MNAVLAGSLKDYQRWLYENQLDKSRYRYIWKPSQLKGLPRHRILFVGEFWNNPAFDSKELDHVLHR